jgi:DNA-binding HxlR family transcriptional regulator
MGLGATLRWTLLVVRELACGGTRFYELRRGLRLMSSSLLVQRLRLLQDAGLVGRERSPDGRGLCYHLTEAGNELEPLVMSFGVWGQRWVRSRVTADDLDAGFLMWDIHRGIATEALPQGRTVVQVDFRDVPGPKGRWWLVVQGGAEVGDGGEVEICLTDPGHEIDIYLESDLFSLTAVWIGDLALDQALREERILLNGPPRLQSAFKKSLKLSPLADVKPARPD